MNKPFIFFLFFTLVLVSSLSFVSAVGTYPAVNNSLFNFGGLI